ncbi:hypothetical protein [Microcystis phage Mae-JY35]
MERANTTPAAISQIASPDAVRVVIFINNQMVHCPLYALLRRIDVPTYADNAAAVAGGLALNDIYKTATGDLRIRV